MGLLDRLLGRPPALARATGPWPLSQTPGVLFASNQSSAGVDVTEDNALSLSAVFAAVNLLSRIVGSLPKNVYRQWGRSKEKALTHPAYRLLHNSPNPEMTASSFSRALEWNRVIGGAAAAEIVWAGNGKPAALYPVEAYRVRPEREEDGSLFYRVDGTRKVQPEDMLYVPHITKDGVVGWGFLRWACESLGLSIAAQEQAARLFSQGARPGGILSHPGNPAPAARQELRKTWEDTHGGQRNAGKTAVLWGGWSFTGEDGTFAPEEAQLLESRKFTTEEVSRWIGVPLTLLAALAAGGTVEQQMLMFLINHLGPILVDYEQEYDRKLLSPPAVYSKHNVGALLRGDANTRANYYGRMVQIGVFSVNDCLELEDMDPTDGGDVHFFPLNMVPLHVAAKGPTVAPPAPPPPPADPGEPPAPLPSGQADPPVSPPAPAAMRALLASTLDRLARVEGNAVRRAAEKPRQFLTWLEEWYPGHQERLAEALAPVAAVAPSWDAAAPGAAWCSASREQLLDVAGSVTAAGLPAAVEALLSRWQGRAEAEAQRILGGGHAPKDA